MENARNEEEEEILFQAIRGAGEDDITSHFLNESSEGLEGQHHDPDEGMERQDDGSGEGMEGEDDGSGDGTVEITKSGEVYIN